MKTTNVHVWNWDEHSMYSLRAAGMTAEPDLVSVKILVQNTSAYLKME